MKQIFVFALFFFSVQILIAQPKHRWQYSEQDVINLLWKNSDSKYQATEVPEEYKDESAVYLNFEVNYETKDRPIKKRVTGYGVTYLTHFRIKILDQAALSDFSEIYLNTRVHGFYKHGDPYAGGYEREKDYFGLKVIKPDGSEVIMSKDDLIEDDEGDKKLAIANLEIGDIIDYYIYQHDYTALSYNPFTLWDKFPIESEYPIVNLNYTLYTDENWKIKFVKKDPNTEIETHKPTTHNEYVFRYSRKNMEPISSTRWHYSYRSSPYLKLFVIHKNNNLLDWENIDGKGYEDSIDPDDILDGYRQYYAKDKAAGNNYRAFERLLKKQGKTNLSKKEKLEEWYYYIRHFFINKHYLYDRFHGKGPRHVTPQEFTGHIIYALVEMDVPYDIIVVTTRGSGLIEDVIEVAETDYLIRAKVPEPIYFYKPGPFTRFNYFPDVIEDTEGFVVGKESASTRSLKVEKITLPKSKYEENIIEYVTNVNMKADDPTILETSTHATYNGHHLFDYQSPLIDWIEMIWDENDLYESKKWGHPSRESGKLKAQVEEFIKEDLNRRNENFKNVAARHFDMEIEEITHSEALNNGNKIGENNLKVIFECPLDGLVSKVGSNYVIKAGKLVGGQITFDESEKERNNDIYMPHARGYDYTVNIKVPEGYEVKGLENFANDVENETGILRSSASVKDGLVTVKFLKIYKNNYESAENWSKMLEFLQPGSEFASKELLFRKK